MKVNILYTIGGKRHKEFVSGGIIVGSGFFYVRKSLFVQDCPVSCFNEKAKTLNTG